MGNAQSSFRGAIVIRRIRPASRQRLWRLEERKREIVAAKASRDLMKAAGRSQGLGARWEPPATSEVQALRLAEILRPFRSSFDALTEDVQEAFLDAIRLYAAGRLSPTEWRGAVRAVKNLAAPP